ncbi:MAG: hypothetical protein P8175_13275 [Deltaproteobacteria bacterium]
MMPVTIAAVRLLSSLLKILTNPLSTDRANAAMQVILRNTRASLLTLIKKEIRKATATIEAVVCLSLSLIKIVANAPITAMAKEIIAISSRTLAFPPCPETQECSLV